MYIIEGNIGAGKSTFLKVINRYLADVTTVDEPVAVWDSQEHGTSLLEYFNKDAHRWSLTMETFAMMNRVKEHLRYQERKESFVVVERSIYSGHYVFSVNGYEQGFMTEKEWHVYRSYFDYLIPGHCKPPRGFIYLRTSPEVAYERVQKRSRSSEECLPLEYLKQLHDRHDSFLIKKENIHEELSEIPVLVLNVDDEFEDNHERSSQLAQQIADFVGIQSTVPLQNLYSLTASQKIN